MKQKFDTPRLELKNFEDKDLHALYCILDDNKKPGTTINFDDVVTDLKKNEDNHHYYALVLKASQVVIGSIYCKKINDDDFEIGYLLNNNYKNSRYASEALYGFVKMLEGEGAKRIVKLEDDKKAKPFSLFLGQEYMSINGFYKIVDFMKD